MAKQLGKLLAFLEAHPNGLTQLESFNTLGICRLSERVRELERLGYLIEHTREKTSGGAHVMRYRLIGTAREVTIPGIGNGIEFKRYPHPVVIYNSEINDPNTWDETPIVEGGLMAREAREIKRAFRHPQDPTPRICGNEDS